MTEAEHLEKLLAVVSHEEENAARRMGKDGCGHWCVSCGHTTSDLAVCGCAFPEAFRCAGGKVLCGACRQGHAKFAAHLETLFAAKVLRVHRADARRSRFFRFLRDALETLAEKGDVQAKTLRGLLGGHCDPRADEPDEFRKTVLDCFSRSHFSDFQNLAKQLAEEERLHDILKFAEAIPEEFLKQYKF